MLTQFDVGGRFACEPEARRMEASLIVDLPEPLDDFEKTGASRDTIRLERRRDSQTDGLLGAARVGHHQIGCERVKMSLYAFD